MSNCPRIVNSSIPNSIVTIDNINDVRISTSSTALGTKVNLTCYTGRTLVGASQLTCVRVGSEVRWDNAIPSCGITTTPTTATGLSQQELIVIGVVAAICILVIIMVIVMLCACWYRRRRDRNFHKRPVSEYSMNTGGYDNRYQPYTMYSPFPLGREGSIDRRSHRMYSSSVPRSTIPDSFPRTSHPSAYELATRSAVVRPKPNMSYAGPRIAKASSDTYEDYLAERNSPNYRPYIIDDPGRSNYDNEGFRGEWTDRYERKKFSDFNRDAYESGRDPFLWDTRSPSAGF